MSDLALVKPKDLSLVDDNSLNPQQLKQLLKKTPNQYVRKRPGKGGQVWEYVSGGYVKKVLNLMFGWDWDFEILSEQIMHGEVVVKGKLTCRTNGHTIVKTQYGNKEIVFKKGTTDPLSIGNDLKSAATDCLKKCAAEIGIAADIYNKDDFREVIVDDEKDNRPEIKDGTLNAMIKQIESGEKDAVQSTIKNFKLNKEQEEKIKQYGIKL